MSDDHRPPVFTEPFRRELYERRVLVLDGPLDDDNGTLLAAQLIGLASSDPTADIALWIHSLGGSVPAMLAIRDVMRLIPCDVATVVLGIAYSAGQFLLSSGTRGKRYALPHSRVLMHQGSAGIGGTAVDVELQAGDLRHTRDTVLGLIAEDTGQPLERVFEDSLHDRWYTAQEAIDYGFVDGILDRFDRLAPMTPRPAGFEAAVSRPAMAGFGAMSTYTIPSVVSQNPRGDRIMDVYSHLLTERVIYLGTGIDAGVANALVAQLLYLDADSPERDVQLYINCEGGDPSAMLAVADTMRYIHADVATTCVGQAVGVGAVLLAAGAAGKRAALPHARVVLHQPASQGRGPIPDLILQADELARVRSEIEQILAEATGRSVETLRADTDHDRVFGAPAAHEYGLIDHVIERRTAAALPAG